MRPTAPIASIRQFLRLWRALLGLSWKADATRTLSVLVLAPATGIAASGYGLTLKWLVEAVGGGQRSNCLAAAVTLAATTVGISLLGTAAARLRLSLQQRIGHVLDANVLTLTSTAIPLPALESSEFQDRMELLQRNRGTIMGAMSSLIENLRVGTQLISVVLLLMSVDQRLLVLPIFAIPAVLAAELSQRVQRRNDLAAAEPARRRRWLLELATSAPAAKELRVYNLGNEVLRRFTLAQRQVNDLDQQVRVRGAIFNLIGWLVFSVGFLGAIWLVLNRAIAHEASAGDVALLVVVASQLDSTVGAAARVFSWLRRCSWAGQHYLWLVDVARSSAESDDSVIAETASYGDLVLDRVSFSYPASTAEALHCVSIRFPAGSTVALVGENGAGKTTLVKLLCQLYEPTVGSISFAGQDLASVNRAAWQGRIAASFQDFYRYQFVVSESVGVGDLSRIDDSDAVWAALDHAEATDFVSLLPNGPATQLGRTFMNGHDLSTGQWQKLAIARAAMRRRPALIVLDEPTGSLDAEAEQALLDGYLGRSAAERAGTVTVIVSHRFATVRAADLIVVMDHGRIIEHGSHSMLLGRRGLYAELYQMHSAGFQNETIPTATCELGASIVR